MNYKQAISEIRARRSSALVRADLMYEQALKSDKELYALEIHKRDLICRAAYGEKLSREIEAAENKIRETLISRFGGLDDFFPPVACDKCGDTGVINGKICDCALKLAVRDSDSSGLLFHDFAEGFASAPDDLKTTYEHMRIFCEKFPDTNTKNVVLMGGPGTGKTYLCGCIAKELALKYSLIFLTAYELNRRLTLYHTTFDETKNDYLDPIIDSDILIIDDLGSEQIIKNITKEYLFVILNERNLKRKATFVTTNLDMKGLEERYGAKTISRLFDKNICYAKVLKGFDLRKI